jgi:hypothetical protein
MIVMKRIANKLLSVSMGVVYFECFDDILKICTGIVDLSEVTDIVEALMLVVHSCST